MAAPVPEDEGSLVANLMHFARTLRAAGLPVGPGKVIDAVAAVRAVGITNRADFYWTLHAVFVNRPDQRPLFDQAFHVFWRNPELLKKMMSLVLPEMSLDLPEDQNQEMLRRLAEALMQLDVLELTPGAINDTLGVLLKYQDDIARIQGSEAAKLLDLIKAEIAAAPRES